MSILLPEPPDPFPSPPPPPRRRRGVRLGPRARRVLLTLAGLGVLLAVLWGAALLYLNSAGTRAQLSARLRALIDARTDLVELGDDLQVDWLGRVKLGPLRVRSAKGQPPFLEIPSVRVRPSYRLLLQGQVVPATVTLERPVLHLDRRAESLRAFWDALQAPPPPGGKATAPTRKARGLESLALFAEGLQLKGGAENTLSLAGPIQGFLSLQREEELLRLRGRLTFADGGRATLQAQRLHGRYTVEAELTALTHAALGDALWSRLPAQLREGTVEGQFRLEGADMITPASASWRLAAKDAWFSGERLAPRPVGPISLGLSGTLTWNPQANRLLLEPARVWLGNEETLFVTLHSSVVFGRHRALEFRAEAKELPFEQLIQALPPQLRPDDSAPAAQGPLTASLSIRGPPGEPEAWEVEPVLELDRLRPSRARNLTGPFEHTAVDAKGRTRNLILGPESGAFVPLERLPEHVVRAVLTSEDAGFFGHDGFEFTEIHDSLIAAIRGTRFRGASTLTQQLAKNLFLSREKTLSRKVKEALITLALEVSVPKERLLEIYLNLIEWGPNLYGVGEAAPHYFGVEASALSPRQAVFLATIIPNPNRYYGYYLKGELTPVWEERVRTLLTKLRDAGHLDEARYQAALLEPLSFRRDAATPVAPR